MRFDVAVVGGGIVGLATARHLALAGRTVVVLEKEAELAVHQSGHNSGVVHAGVYYAPGSLKARLCVEGKAALERYAIERALPFRRVGKLIVALDSAELPRLAELKRRGVANGVEGLREVDASELREIEPHVRGVRALHSPGTAITDYRAVAHAYAGDVQAAGGEVRTACLVTRCHEDGVETAAGSVRAGAVVVCAGLQADRLAPRGARVVPFRGDYYTLRPRAAELVRGLIYPVPDPAFPFLGVHFTRTVDDRVVAGPNAVLALARERYGRAAISARDALSALTTPALWRFAARHWRVGAGEVWRDVSRRAFVRDMQRYVPEIRDEDVVFGPSGIRAQLLSRDGRLVDDFVLERDGNVLHVLNAPSPAATSSLAIARVIAEAVAGSRS